MSNETLNHDPTPEEPDETIYTVVGLLSPLLHQLLVGGNKIPVTIQPDPPVPTLLLDNLVLVRQTSDLDTKTFWEVFPNTATLLPGNRYGADEDVCKVALLAFTLYVSLRAERALDDIAREMLTERVCE